MTETVALYGGSFNPPHLGHVQVVTWLLSATDVDAVWLVPCASHAFGKGLAPFDDRMEMCRLAMADFRAGRVVVSDVEGQLGGPNRTVDTVRHLWATHPGVRFDLVFGADILHERAQWKEFDVLERECRIHWIGRPGYVPPSDLEGTRPAAPELLDVSSTRARAGLAAGDDVSMLLPRRVIEFARKTGAYA